MPTFFSRVVSFTLRLIMWAFAAVFALSLLLAGLVLLAVGLLRSLITGQKPRPMVFARFQQFPHPPWSGASRPVTPARRESDVVDVEVREIPDHKRTP